MSQSLVLFLAGIVFFFTSFQYKSLFMNSVCVHHTRLPREISENLQTNRGAFKRENTECIKDDHRGTHFHLYTVRSSPAQMPVYTEQNVKHMYVCTLQTHTHKDKAELAFMTPEKTKTQVVQF